MNKGWQKVKHLHPFLPAIGVITFVILGIQNGYERDFLMSTPIIDNYTSMLWLGLTLSIILTTISLISKRLVVSLLAVLAIGLFTGTVLNHKPDMHNYSVIMNSTEQ